MKHLLLGSLGLLRVVGACSATPEATNSPTSQVEETPREEVVDTPAKEVKTVETGKSGQFVDGGHPASGTVNLVKKRMDIT